MDIGKFLFHVVSMINDDDILEIHFKKDMCLYRIKNSLLFKHKNSKSEEIKYVRCNNIDNNSDLITFKREVIAYLETIKSE